MNLADLRLSYTKAGLLEADAHADAIEQFRIWFEQALTAEIPEPNGMALATVGRSGIPDVRMVLLKGFDERGFVFYTNYRSRKGIELEENARAALLFYWQDLERQVRINGVAAKVSDEDADAYFASRPRGHQLGAWASNQSEMVQSRAVLEQNLQTAADRFEGQPVPRPPYWGGYRLVPDVIEFWQGRPDRLHDRLEYARTELGWEKRRLAP
jgi:pyridoxamine 5'-phosphate oxidase